MFDKNKFALILKNINDTYISQRDFSRKSEINRTYLSQYMNMKLDDPPKPKILEKIANASNGMVSYEDLMYICGYINFLNSNEYAGQAMQYIIEENINNQYFYLNSAFDKLIQLTTNNDMIKNVLNNFTIYCDNIIENANNIYYNKFLSDYIDIEEPLTYKGFKILYSALLKRLYPLRTTIKHGEIFLINKHLLSKTNIEDTKKAINIVETTKIHFNNLYKKYIQNIDSSYNSSNFLSDQLKNIGAMYVSKTDTVKIPILGTVKAGYDYMAQENWIGTIDVEKTIIKQGYEYFALKVTGDSMFPVLLEDDIVIVRKQDSFENGDIVIAIVNGDEATIKKAKKTENSVLLQPINSNYEPLMFTYDEMKTIPVTIVGIVKQLKREF